MRDSLGGHSPHGCSHLGHLEVVLSVAVTPNGSIAVDDSPYELHIDVGGLALGQVGRRRKFEPQVETEAIEVPCNPVQDSWLEMCLAVSQKNTRERLLLALLVLEICGKSLGNDA